MGARDQFQWMAHRSISYAYDTLHHNRASFR
jgi:hypothetical protein